MHITDTYILNVGLMNACGDSSVNLKCFAKNTKKLRELLGISLIYIFRETIIAIFRKKESKYRKSVS